MVAECVDGKQDGAPMRTLTTTDGAVLVERRVQYSDEGMSYSYQILESPLPVADYESTLAVMDGPEGSIDHLERRVRRQRCVRRDRARGDRRHLWGGPRGPRRSGCASTRTAGNDGCAAPPAGPRPARAARQRQEGADRQVIAARAQHQLAVRPRRVVDRDPRPVGLEPPFARLPARARSGARSGRPDRAG